MSSAPGCSRPGPAPGAARHEAQNGCRPRPGSPAPGLAPTTQAPVPKRGCRTQAGLEPPPRAIPPGSQSRCTGPSEWPDDGPGRSGRLVPGFLRHCRPAACVRRAGPRAAQRDRRDRAYLLGRASAWPPEARSSAAGAARAGARGPSDPCAVSAPASSSAAGSDLSVSSRVFRSLRIKLQPPPATLAARATSSAVTGAASSW